MKRLVLALVSLSVFPLFSQGVVKYEDHGAVGDGKTNDFAAIVKAHQHANSLGLPVEATSGKTYYIGQGNETAIIQTDVDFKDAVFVIDDSEIDVNSRGRWIFSIRASKPDYKVPELKTLKRNQENIGLTFETPVLLTVTNSKVKRYIRYGANQNKGSAQTDIILVDQKGNVDMKAPIIWDFDEITDTVASPLDEKMLTVRGGVFKTIANKVESKYTYYARGIQIMRSNVTITVLRHEVSGEGDHGAPYSGFLNVVRCANVTIQDTVLTGHKTYGTIGSAGRPVSMGTYDFGANRAINITLKNCRQTNDITNRKYWGIMGSNYCKNLTYDGCELSRFDAHMGVANATIKNSKLGHQGINAIGTGTFLLENSTVYGGAMINLRGDYGSTWEGEFIIRNCTFVPAAGAKTTGNIIGGSYSGKHDFGYPCFMPETIVVENVTIDDSNHPDNYQGPAIFSNFNRANKDAGYVEDFPYAVTKQVLLKNVKTKSGKPIRLSDNPWMFRNVKVVTQND